MNRHDTSCGTRDARCRTGGIETACVRGVRRRRAWTNLKARGHSVSHTILYILFTLETAASERLCSRELPRVPRRKKKKGKKARGEIRPTRGGESSAPAAVGRRPAQGGRRLPKPDRPRLRRLDATSPCRLGPNGLHSSRQWKKQRLQFWFGSREGAAINT